jgi:hypothetical protein
MSLVFHKIEGVYVLEDHGRPQYSSSSFDDGYDLSVLRNSVLGKEVSIYVHDDCDIFAYLEKIVEWAKRLNIMIMYDGNAPDLTSRCNSILLKKKYLLSVTYEYYKG